MSDVQAQAPVENPFVNAQAPEPESNSAAEQAVDEATQEAEQPVDPVETHESILNGLLSDLEGMSCMSKSEVEHIVASARAKHAAL